MSKPKTKTPKAKAKEPSRISKAVEFMAAEVKKQGGAAKLERGARKVLCAKAAEKFGIAVATCVTQYQKQVRHG
jgi:hypothetical protein